MGPTTKQQTGAGKDSGGMTRWSANNWNEAERRLVRDYRIRDDPKRAHLVEARFLGEKGQKDLKDAAKLAREYQNEAQRRVHKNMTGEKRLEKSKRRKFLEEEGKKKEQRKKELVEAALVSLIDGDLPDVDSAVQSLRKVVGPSAAIGKPSFRSRQLVEWGHRQLKIVDPPGSGNSNILQRMCSFGRFLEDYYHIWYGHFKKVHKAYDPTKPNQGSVRPIDGLRLEFMLTGKMGYVDFLTLVDLMNETGSYPQMNPETFRVDMIAYAHRQIREDDRTVELEVLKDEALIVSTKGTSAEQNPHLDIQDSRNIQGVMIITGGKDILATYEYEPEKPVVVDLPTFLAAYPDIPPTLAEVLLRPASSATNKVQTLLAEYGKVLSKTVVKVSNQPAVSETSPLKTGALLTLPGGVIHAGPATKGVRAILFLAATSKGTCKYNPDAQYNRTNMWATIAAALWGTLSYSNDTEGKEYLLDKIEESARAARSSSAMIQSKPLRDFAALAETANKEKTTTMETRGDPAGTELARLTELRNEIIGKCYVD